MSALTFAHRWRQRAAEVSDPYDRFFSSWIAIVVVARQHLAYQELSQPDTDRNVILHYFELHAATVVAVLASLQDNIEWLATRKGTALGHAMLDVHSHSPEHLRPLFDDLAEVWSGDVTRKPRWVANATAEMINHIRNNLFHGAKAPDDAADKQLLERVNPILIGVLDQCSHVDSDTACYSEAGSIR